MKTREIRQSFIDFFKSKGHEFVPPVPVIPKGDPTLLFINAGMNPFKPYFLGEEEPKYKRVVNSQKCIRVSGKHNDLEEVGHDTYHHTFFEMLGNWSFGDYYKKEAIKWAWELLTEVWKLPKDRLYATIYLDDDEAYEIWKEETDIDPNRILRFGEKDNFWEMGETGPCGPCSEIHIDLGEEFDNSPDAFVNTGSPRFIEIWNLVFIQYYRDENGILHPLKDKHVDTGMGLERISSILQETYDNYAIDIFKPIKDAIYNICGLDWNESNEIKVAYRVIMDHIRTLTFAINDGVIPSNEGRGYVIRRILRRAFRYGRKLDLHEPFLYKLVDAVIDAMSDYYTELKNNPARVKEIIRSEEERFNKTIDRGIEIFNDIVNKLEKENKKVIDGKDVFLLYDTYGFPPDLTNVMAQEKGFSIDWEEYNKEMEKQKERAREASKFKGNIDYDYLGEWNTFEEDKKTEFVGYEKYECEAKILRYLIKDDLIYVILDKTPFYAESGGQVADTGFINGKDFVIKVNDVQKYKEFFVHIGTLEGEIIDNKVFCEVDRGIRRDTMRNHSATHLLQSALRLLVSEEIRQAGSFNNNEKLRFDFTYDKPIGKEKLREVEKLVNEWINRDYKVEVIEMPLEEAKKVALAVFDEKYGDIVRVVKMGDVSSELCGGTHVPSTGFIDAFVIVSESSIASGVRRIEAITGKRAIEKLLNYKYLVADISEELNISENDFKERIENIINENNALKKEIKALKKEIGFSFDEKKIVEIKGIKVYKDNLQFEEKDDLKNFVDAFNAKFKDGIFIGTVSLKNKTSYLVIVGDSLVKDYHAGEVVKKLASFSGGKGGGKANMAQASVGDESKVNEALNRLGEIL